MIWKIGQKFSSKPSSPDGDNLDRAKDSLSALVNDPRLSAAARGRLGGRGEGVVCHRAPIVLCPLSGHSTEAGAKAQSGVGPAEPRPAKGCSRIGQDEPKDILKIEVLI